MKQEEWKIEYDIPAIPNELLEAGYNPLLARVLSNIGYSTAESAEGFINCDKRSVLNPFRLNGMTEAVERIRRAISDREKVAVFGDYDVDGITATAVITDYLMSKEIDVLPFIPSRDDGYGLNTTALEKFRNDGITLVISVDCGITAKAEVEYASQQGIDVIITDHHECKEDEMPSNCIVIDPKQPGCSYPFKSLAGVGVAFKLICAIDGDTDKMLDRYCDLVAIGTVADVMPLKDENRFYVRRGLESIRKTPRHGIKAMLEESHTSIESLSAASIGYTLAPRINAAGRMDKAIKALDLILCKDEESASKLSKELCALNSERQKKETEIWTQALKQLEEERYDRKSPIVLSSRSWHPGVIGIAASRLAEHYRVPTIMICMNDDGTGKGSCRSYNGFNLFGALKECSSYLITYGGHSLAAGLNIKNEDVGAFKDALTKYFMDNPPEPKPEFESKLLINDPSLLSVENVRSLEKLEPYGSDNPKPLMCMTGAKLEFVQPVGADGKHLKMRISAGSSVFDAIFFSKKISELGVTEGNYIDIMFTPNINEFRGNINVQLTVSAVRPHRAGYMCTNIIDDNCSFFRAARFFTPQRQDFVNVWKNLTETASTIDEIICDCPSGMLPERFCICLKVFEEAGLITSALSGTRILNTDKKELNDTVLMKKLNDER